MPKLTKKEIREQNEPRAQRARNALDGYALEVGKDESNLADLLTDLMHLSAIDCEALDFDVELRRARMNFEAEHAGRNA